MKILSVIILPQAPKVNDPEDLKRYIRQLHKVLDEFHATTRDDVSEIETDVEAIETEVTAIKAGAINFCLFCNSGSNLTGVRGILRVPFSCTLTDYYLLANKDISVVIDIWKDTYTSFPPTVADTLIGGGGTKPTLTAAAKAKDTTLTGWSKIINADDILFFNVDSATVTASEADPAVISLSLRFDRN